MPEIAEIARIAHYLRTHLLNRTISRVHATDDPIVFDSKANSKGACTASSFISALSGRKVIGVGQQGKYFWMELSGSGPHPLMHFGMTGWIFIRVEGKDIGTAYWGAEKMKSKGGESTDVWPPKFEKFRLEMQGTPNVEASFVDARRLGRVRLINVPAAKMRESWPLNENGPDPVIDKDVLTRKWLGGKLATKKVPIKAWLLDQANLSGVGNWVGDEILWNARIHPEQYCNTLTEAQVDKLFEKIMFVCDFACRVLGNKNEFPDDWLFDHRKAGKVPTGEKIVLLKVGGRTSAVVPSLQKKTGEGTSDEKVEAVELAKTESKADIKAKSTTKAKAANGESGKANTKKRKAEEPEEKPIKKEKAKESTTGRRKSTRTK